MRWADILNGAKVRIWKNAYITYLKSLLELSWRDFKDVCD
jgi:hypothetical protein